MQESEASFKQYLNPVGAWALAFGCTIGWGAFLVPETLLPASGVMGSIVGVAIGFVVMLVIAKNYHAMMNEYPNAGGAFAFTCHALGFDRGFLCGWFLSLTYMGLIWANISAFALLARFLFGGVFGSQLLYTFAGFDIYLEEVVLCMAAIVAAGLVCLYRKKLAQNIQILCAGILALGLVVLFVLVLNAHPPDLAQTPLFLPGESPVMQVFRTIVIVPWAFVGFESVSNSAQEFSFSPKRSFRIMGLAILMAALAYVFMVFISVSAIPSGYSNWVEYINDLGSLSGLSAVPTFSAIYLALGDTGIALLGLTMFGALFSSLVGCVICLSRLVCSMAHNGIFPERFAQTDNDGIPHNAIVAIVLVSLAIPLLGRTAIGWNMDISNIGASIAYGYTSVSAFRQSKRAGNAKGRVFGAAGAAIAVVFLALTILPSNALARESYLIFTWWIIVGFFLNYRTFKRDAKHRYGKSSVVWVVLFALSLYASVSFVWLSGLTASHEATTAIEALYSAQGMSAEGLQSGGTVGAVMDGYRITQMGAYLLTLLFILVSFGILMGNYSILKQRELESERELGETRAKAFTDKLTGVKSINAYRDREREINERIENGVMTPFAVAICDVNDVKEVNDTKGHQAGDDFIRAGCKVICDRFNHSPVYRIGGDEFVVLMEGRDFDRRDEIAECFQNENLERMKQGGVIIALGATAWRPGEDTSLADAFERADFAMYKQKRELKALRASLQAE